MTTDNKFKLQPINFKLSKKDRAKILIAQSTWNEDQLMRDSLLLYRLGFNSDNEQFLRAILAKAKEKDVDLIVFPEFSIPRKYHEEIRQWSEEEKNIIIVAGSDYLEHEKKYYNTASIFFQGQHYTTQKLKLSPHEDTIFDGYGPSEGYVNNYFENTPIGNLAVMICMDAFHENIRHELIKLSLDILCIISVQSPAKEHHQVIDRLVKDKKEGCYIVYCNAFCANADGRSAFFGHNYKNNFDEVKESDDGIDKRAFEMPKTSGCFIVDCNLKEKIPYAGNKDYYRSLIKVVPPFIFQNGQLEQMMPGDFIKKSPPSSIIYSQPVNILKYHQNEGFNKILRKVLKNESIRNFRSFDIRKLEQVEKAIEWFEKEPTISKFSCNKSIKIEKHLSLIKKAPYYPSAESEKNFIEKRIISVALSPTLIGASTLIFFLKKESYKIKVEYELHGADIIKKTEYFGMQPDVIIGAEGMVVEFFKSNLGKNYELFMILHYFDTKIVAPISRDDLTCEDDLKGNLFIPNNKDSYNGLFVTKERIQNRISLLDNMNCEDQQPHMALAKLLAPTINDIHLLYSLHAEFAKELGLGRTIELNNNNELIKIPVIIVAKKEFSESDEGINFFSALIRGWKKLQYDENEINTTIQFMLSDNEYTEKMFTLSGYEDYIIELRHSIPESRVKS